MLREIKSLFLGNRSLDLLSIPVDTRREKLERKMFNLVAAARDRALAGGKWQPKKETLAIEGELLHLFEQVVLGHATIDEFQAACRRWETAGSI